MKPKTLLLSILLAFSACFLLHADNSAEFDKVFKRMAQKLSAVEGKLANKTVAVYGFQVIGRPDDPYAIYATEKITHELVNSGGLMVIERSRMEEILKEQDFSHSPMVDTGTAARIGKILAVDAVITGTILVTEARTEFIVRAIQSERGLILASVDDSVTFTVTATASSGGKPAGDANTAMTDVDSMARSTAKLSADKSSYAANEGIAVTFSGLPGNDTDWITLVDASKPDDSYGQYSYTDGKKEGSLSFEGVPAGDYEIRVYFDWPAGGYAVRGRIKVKVE